MVLQNLLDETRILSAMFRIFRLIKFWNSCQLGWQQRQACYETILSGFPKLKHLALLNINFSHPDVFSNVITKRPMLATLIIEHCYGIDINSLETLTVVIYWESLAFGDVQNLKSISLNLDSEYCITMNMGAIDAVKLLGSSSQLECIQFDGNFCKFLADEGGLGRSSVAFNYLNKLCL